MRSLLRVGSAALAAISLCVMALAVMMFSATEVSAQQVGVDCGPPTYRPSTQTWYCPNPQYCYGNQTCTITTWYSGGTWYVACPCVTLP